MTTMQFYLTPAAGKALIAKAIIGREDVKHAMSDHTLLIVGGTTNTYVAREALSSIGQDMGDAVFYRGITKPGAAKAQKPMLQGDVLIRKGIWQKGASVDEAAGELGRGDMIFKGANAVHLCSGEAGVLIGNPRYGTMAPVTQAVLGAGAYLMIPVGVEKRVDLPISQLMKLNNCPQNRGLRLSPMPGSVYTELDALRDLGAQEAAILSAGGVCGYEGGCYFVVSGQESGLEAVREEIEAVKDTAAFAI